VSLEEWENRSPFLQFRMAGEEVGKFRHFRPTDGKVEMNGVECFHPLTSTDTGIS